MFRGLTAINVDNKGRIAIPVRYRPVLMELANGQVVLTIDTEDRCLLLYPTPYWQEIEYKLQQLPSLHPTTRRIQRLLIGHATDLEMDNNGRILLPPLLREYANLEKCVMLVGQGKKFEVWSEEYWQQSRSGWLAEETKRAILPPELSSLAI